MLKDWHCDTPVAKGRPRMVPMAFKFQQLLSGAPRHGTCRNITSRGNVVISQVAALCATGMAISQMLRCCAEYGSAAIQSPRGVVASHITAQESRGMSEVWWPRTSQPQDAAHCR
jgi:hypothetical protein